MLDLIDGRVRLVRHLFQTHPDQDRTPNMVADNPCLATLTSFQAGDLLGFAMKLLNLPTPAAYLVDGWRRILRHVIGDNIVRALGRQHNPEQFHFGITRQTLQLDAFATVAFLRGPEQAIHALIWLLPARVINLTVIFDWTVVDLLQAVNQLHQRNRGIPRI